MRASAWKAAIAMMVAIVVMASRANATTLTFYLNQSGTGPVGNAGTITLDDTIGGANTVNILVTLNSDYKFVKTGAGDALAFNILGDPSISIVDITSGFAIGPTNHNQPPFGSFNYAVSCTTGCGNGGSNPNPGPLSFDVQLVGITLGSFVGNGAGYYFASDLIGPGPNGDRVTGNMGALGRTGDTQISAVPEPASLMLFGTGLAFAARKLRRRSQDSATN
jgi:hypothetical protein